MKKVFLELYQHFVECTKEKNDKVLLEYKNSNLEFASKEMLSLWISECLIEDINVIQYFKDNKFRNRYVDAVIRNICEQVIEYLYIMKHQELIKIYFGENLNKEFNEDDPFKVLKQTGQARFGKRENIKKMAKDIGQLNSDDDKISLYEIFSWKAELEHNSYFNHIFDIVEEVEELNGKEEEKSKKDIDFIFLIFIISSFLEIYDTI